MGWGEEKRWQKIVSEVLGNGGGMNEENRLKQRSMNVYSERTEE